MKSLQSLLTVGALSLAIFAIALVELKAQDKVALYDNLTEPLPDFQGRSLFPTADVKGRNAQPFKTGEFGILSSVAMPFALLGSPTGLLSIEVWDDVNRKPGSKVADVGKVDLETLASVDDGAEIVRFEELEIHLDPNTEYHLVVDDSNTTIVDSNNSNIATQ